MIRDIQEGAIYALFVLAALYATLPVWRIPLIGLNPKLDQILAAGCGLVAVEMHFATFNGRPGEPGRRLRGALLVDPGGYLQARYPNFVMMSCPEIV